MADVRKILIEIDAKTGNVVGGIATVNKELDNLGSKAKLATKEVSAAAKAMQKNMAGSAGVAGAATAEFGRLISDLPFGLMAVTNNISQLGNMFALLVSSAGGARKALGVFLSTLMGPAGVLVAFQALVAILPKVVEMLKGTAAVTEKLAKAQGAAAGELKAFRDALRLGMLSSNDAIIAIDDLNNKYDDLNISLGENVQLTDQSKDSLDKLIESMEQAARAKAAMTLVSDLYQKQLEQEIFLEKIRNDELTGFSGWLENVNQQFLAIGANPYLGVLAPFFDEGEGKELRVQLLEKGLNGTKEQIQDILQIVGEDGLVTKLFEGRAGKPEREAFFMMTDKEKEAFDKFMEDMKSDIDEFYNFGKDAVFEFEKGFNETLDQQADKFKGFLSITEFEEEEPYFPYVNLLKLEGELALEQEIENNEKLKKERERAAQEKLDIEIATINALADIKMGEADIIESVFRTIADISEKSKFIQALALVGESAAGIAKIVIDTQAANAALRLQQSALLVPNPAAAAAIGLKIKSNKIAAAAGIAANVGATATALSRLKAPVGGNSAASVGGVEGGTTVPLLPAFNVVGAAGQNQLAAAIASAQQQPVKAYVVSSDVTTAQQLDRSIIQGASI